MNPKNAGWNGPLAAGLLALLTFSVFFQLRDYGPESALRRFHRASIEDNQRMLQAVAKEDVNSPDVLNLRRRLSRLNQLGARIRLGRVHREIRVDTVSGATARVTTVVSEVRYYAGREVDRIYWVVDHAPSGWVVNAHETLAFPFKKLGMDQPG